MWDNILSALGGYAVMVTAITYLTKSIVTHWLSKSVETYKADLLQRHSLELEKFRHDLQVRTEQEISKRINLQQRQAELGSRLSCLLHDVMTDADFLLMLPDLRDECTKSFVDEYRRKYELLTDHYYSSYIYFPDELMNLVDSIRNPLIQITAYINLKSSKVDALCKRYQDTVDRWSSEKEERQKVFAKIETEIQIILGVLEKK